MDDEHLNHSCSGNHMQASPYQSFSIWIVLGSIFFHVHYWPCQGLSVLPNDKSWSLGTVLQPCVYCGEPGACRGTGVSGVYACTTCANLREKEARIKHGRAETKLVITLHVLEPLNIPECASWRSQQMLNAVLCHVNLAQKVVLWGKRSPHSSLAKCSLSLLDLIKAHSERCITSNTGLWGKNFGQHSKYSADLPWVWSNPVRSVEKHRQSSTLWSMF